MGDVEEDNSSWSVSDLFCNEDEASCLTENESSDCFDDEENIHNNIDYERGRIFSGLELEDEGYIERLIEAEEIGFLRTSLPSSNDCSAISYNNQWIKHARLEAVQWIINTRAIFGFQFRTAYLSVTYMDRFLSKRFIDEGKLWAIRLLCLACLSLAAKMEERRVPPLTEFPMEDYIFKSKTILKMELLVLTVLDWKMRSITPFAYVHYFINKINGESRSKQSKAVELIMTITKEVNSLDHRPSIVAAAAALAASSGKLTRKDLECKMDGHGIPSWGLVDNEHIFSCYIAMQKIEMLKLKTPEQIISPNSSSKYPSSIDVRGHSCFTTGVGMKRRLRFDDSDKYYPLKKNFSP